MSDLISREKFVESIKKFDFGSFFSGTEKEYIESTIIALINLQPTAYEINKVVEKLNELEVKENTRYKNGDFGDFDGVDYYIKKSDAIEIVKHGGVSDDVCECRLLNGHKFLHETSCGDVFDMQNGFKYCPFCGKKIKVVD